jgi:hypothetical protein
LFTDFIPPITCMRHSNFPPGVLAAVFSACATESLKLNSEHIEQRFGNYGIDILASEAGLRRSSLYSRDGDTRTCRTYAVVQFADPLDERHHPEHSKVLEGNSIGAIFREGGWDIFKKTLYVGHIRLPESPTRVRELMRLTGSHDLALHVYQLLLARDSMETQYATILEAHHPEYLSEEDLHRMFDYDAAAPLPARDIAALTELVLNRKE